MIKVAELSDVSLDYWVARAKGFSKHVASEISQKCLRPVGRIPVICNGKEILVESFEKAANRFSPSSNWAEGGPIIEQELIAIFFGISGHELIWGAEVRAHGEAWIDTTVWDCDAQGPTALIAAMRAYVSSKFGQEFKEDL